MKAPPPLAVLVLLAGLVLMPVQSAQSAPSARAAKGEWIVASPHPGERIGSSPVELVVRSRDGLYDLQARLNGHTISREFGPTRAGLRRARVSASQGLVHGKNVLRVKTKRRNGKWRRTTIRFFVQHRRPLAGAGLDRRVVVDNEVTLRASALRVQRSSGGRVGYRWKLVAAPRNSGLRKQIKQSAAARPSAGASVLTSGPGPTLAFTPDVPGPYTFKLTAGDRSGSTADKVTINAVPPTPLVTIDTLVDEHRPDEAVIPAPGIKVGDTIYREDVSVGNAWLQVLVLDRETLGFVSNKTYSCVYPFNCGPTVANDLKALDESKLVIAASHSNFVHPYDMPQALAPIGFPKLDPLSFFNAAGGTVSAIGVPGLPPGQADVKFFPDGPLGAGNMSGYLTPDQYFNYGWLPKERPLFDTRAPGTNASQNVIQVAGQNFVAPGGPFSGAFQVEALDGHTLQRRDHETFFPGYSLDPEYATQQAVRMTDFLNSKLRAGDLVVIDGLGNDPLINQQADASALRDLASAIASVGGTRHVFNTSGIVASSNYSLVGSGGAGEANGTETSSVKDPKHGDGRIRGALLPDHQSLFKPTITSVADQPSETLIQLMLQPATPWPLDGKPGAQKAIAYLGSQENRLGSDPRSAYWIQPFDQATWDQIAGVVKQVKYPGDDKSGCKKGGFCEKDFAAARKELFQEITWVGDVRAYLKSLSSPFAENALSSWANMTVIADKAIGSIKPPNEEAAMLTLDVIEAVISVVAIGSEEVGAPIEVIAQAYNIGLNFLTQSRDGSDATEIRANASEIAAQLIESLQSAQASFSSTGNIIVSDYAKLKTVGTNGGCNPENNPKCPAEWAFNSKDQQAAATAFYKGVEGLFDQSFMTIAFPPFRLEDSGPGQTDFRKYPCSEGIFFPFAKEPDKGGAALLRELPSFYDVYAMGDLGVLSLTNYIPGVPPNDVLERMFGSISPSLDPKAGGLGIFAPDFVRRASPGTYNEQPKPGLTVKCGPDKGLTPYW